MIAADGNGHQFLQLALVKQCYFGGAAANIDKFLGFNHEIKTDIEVPAPKLENKPARGRINTAERPVFQRRNDFGCIEIGLTEEEALFESSRCLRCDASGFGTFRGGREFGW